MRAIAGFFIILVVFFLFCSCGRQGEDVVEAIPPLTITSLNSPDKMIGVCSGTTPVSVIKERFPSAKMVYFPDGPSGYRAVLTHKVDAFAFDNHVLDYNIKKMPGLAVIPGFTSEVHLGIGAAKSRSHLIDRVNEFIRQYKTDGTFDDMFQRWTSVSDPTMPELPEPKSPDGTLVIGTEAINPPMNFRAQNGDVVGFDIEFAKRLAFFLNKKCKVVVLSWDALLLAVEKDKIDLMIAQLDNIPEHRERILLSNDYIKTSTSLLVLRSRLPGTFDMINDTAFDVLIRKGRVGVQTGSVHEEHVLKRKPGHAISRYDEVPDLVQALRASKIDMAYINQHSFLGLRKKSVDDLCLLVRHGYERSIGIACSKGDDDLRVRINQLLSEYEHSGLLEEMSQRWFNSTEYEVVDIPERGENAPCLRIATALDLEPIAFVHNGEVAGFDIELIRRLAYDLGLRPEITNYSFKGVLPAVVSGRADIALSLISITDERAEAVNFSRPYLYDEYALLVRRDWLKLQEPTLVMEETANELAGNKMRVVHFLSWLYHGFEKVLFEENRWVMILHGLGVSLLITILSALVGTLLGLLFYIVRRSRCLFFAGLIHGFICIMQGIPMVVFLLFLYYVVFVNTRVSGLFIAVFGFSIILAVSVSEMIRKGIEAVNPAQTKAAMALGFSRIQIFRYITFPQAVSALMPRYKKDLLTLFKATAIVGFIAVEDLTKICDIIRSSTYDAFFPLFIAMVLYLCCAWILVLILSQIEKRINPGQPIPLDFEESL